MTEKGAEIMEIMVFALAIMLISQGVKAIMKEREEKKILEEEKREAESWEKKNVAEKTTVEDKEKRR